MAASVEEAENQDAIVAQDQENQDLPPAPPPKPAKDVYTQRFNRKYMLLLSGTAKTRE
jgi:hypothetical protein